jgi:3-oxoacyl-[acyl-carrier-protein] synthase-3
MKSFPGSIIDIEYHLPEKTVENSYFAENFPEWDVTKTAGKTGVSQRKIAAADETAYDLSLKAVKKLLSKHPGLQDQIDAIVYCTQSADYIMPGNSFLLQRDLGIKRNILAFDFNLACSGYLYGLLMSSSLMKTGMCKNILFVTADTYSKYIDENDRSTRLLFGDGAAASWIGFAKDHDVIPLVSEFIDFKCGSDGSIGWDKFIIPGNGLKEPAPSDERRNKIYMNGLHVLSFVNSKVLQQIDEILKENTLAPEDIDVYFLHQASQMALNSIAGKFKIPNDKMFSNLNETGNTVSSSIPILIKDFFSKKELSPGSNILLSGFGVGFSWSSLIAKK